MPEDPGHVHLLDPRHFTCLLNDPDIQIWLDSPQDVLMAQYSIEKLFEFAPEDL